MHEIPMPPLFFDFCKAFHQDWLIYGPEPEDWIRAGVRFVARDKQSELRVVLVELLTKSYTDEELEDLFSRTLTDVSFRSPGALRRFLTLAVDVLDRDARKAS